VLEATFRGELENCLLTLMVASPRDPTAAVQAGIKRLAAVAAAAPALRADCARIIRAPLFAVLESPSDAGGRRARWHLPLDVHEAAVREALVPLCSSEVASGADDGRRRRTSARAAQLRQRSSRSRRTPARRCATVARPRRHKRRATI
jgi:hypothetical protein